MAWLICGTVPEETYPLGMNTWDWHEDGTNPVLADRHGKTLPVRRGTPALMAAAALTCRTLGIAPPETLLVGDTGKGDGSRALYRFLAEQEISFAGLTFHYLFPDLDGHSRVLMALQNAPARPLLVADAGFMYVAKMSGYADAYDLFTPDIGELAFLADETAPHPFYTRGFLLAEEEEAPELIRRAYAHGNCAQNLLVKGRIDRIVAQGSIVQEILEPQIPNMEPIGGTGDLVTGLVTGLLAAQTPLLRACAIAARTNRLIGALSNPTPATQVAELLPALPEALTEALRMERA